MCWSTGEGDKRFFWEVAGMYSALKAFRVTSASHWAAHKPSAACSASIETNPLSCRSSEPCTASAEKCSSPALSLQICASVNGFCVAAGAEQSEFRLLHSSRYWPTLSLIILANIDTACVVSHLYPLLPLPCLTEWEKTREREQKTDGDILWKDWEEWWDNKTELSSLFGA